MHTHGSHVVRGRRRRLFIVLACAVAAMAMCTLDWAGAGRSEGGGAKTVAAYQRGPQAFGLFSPDYSVAWAFISATWGKSGPIDEAKVFAGGKRRVDTRLGSWTFSDGDPPPGLGEGTMVRYLGGRDRLYQDQHGVRLISQVHLFPDTLILSAQCTHEAQPVRQDLGALHTDSGVGLGDSEASILKRLGNPCRRDRYQEYVLLWYRQIPKHVVGANAYDQGHVAIYTLKTDHVVEIWLHEWDTGRRG